MKVFCELFVIWQVIFCAYDCFMLHNTSGNGCLRNGGACRYEILGGVFERRGTPINDKIEEWTGRGEGWARLAFYMR